MQSIFTTPAQRVRSDSTINSTAVTVEILLEQTFVSLAFLLAEELFRPSADGSRQSCTVAGLKQDTDSQESR